MAFFFAVVMELLLGTIVFFVLIAAAYLFDAGILFLKDVLNITESVFISNVRIYGKYAIIIVDCVVVGAFVIRGAIKTFKELFGGK